MDKRSLLARIHETHAVLDAAVRSLDDTALETPASGMEGWSRKDVVAHVAWWSDHSAQVIEALRAGREPYPRDEQPGIDELNARILDDHRDDTPDAVRRSEADAFSRLVAAVEAASDEDLFTVARFAWIGRDEPLAEMVEWDSTRHYPDHLAQLRA
jgi:hypothetical protein